MTASTPTPRDWRAPPPFSECEAREHRLGPRLGNATCRYRRDDVPPEWRGLEGLGATREDAYADFCARVRKLHPAWRSGVAPKGVPACRHVSPARCSAGVVCLDCGATLPDPCARSSKTLEPPTNGMPVTPTTCHPAPLRDAPRELASRVLDAVQNGHRHDPDPLHDLSLHAEMAVARALTFEADPDAPDEAKARRLRAYAVACLGKLHGLAKVAEAPCPAGCAGTLAAYRDRECFCYEPWASLSPARDDGPRLCAFCWAPVPAGVTRGYCGSKACAEAGREAEIAARIGIDPERLERSVARVLAAASVAALGGEP